MPRIACVLLALMSVLLAAGLADAARLRVVATTPDLKALTEAVTADFADVEALTRGAQNFHDVEVRPSMMLKLRNADVLVENGLDLDAWVDVAARGANNARIVPGALGRVDASRNVPVLDVPTGPVDRAQGDVHPRGNPHYSLDPGLAGVVTQTILEGLARVAPDLRPAFEKNRHAFVARVEAEITRWTRTLQPVQGAKVVGYHEAFVYFLRRFGLVHAGVVEDRPGISPSPGHVARLIQQMKRERIKAVAMEPWSDRKLAERIAGEAGARVVVLAPSVGAIKGADTYLAAIDHNVRTLAEALR